jgi:RNA polymerase sigma factor (sigma-70 family)
MSDCKRDFASLMGLVCSGSEEAAGELVNRYGDYVLRAVRRRLNRQLRPKFDSADFVQAVWASFFALPLGRYQFDRSEALVGFLINLAANKVVEAVRQRLQTQKYNVNREQPLEDERGHPVPNLVSRERSPEAVAIAREEWERLLRDQPEHYREILTSLGGGATQREVAHRLGINESTVRRVVRKLAPRHADERE